jgi:hypothetical protein
VNDAPKNKLLPEHFRVIAFDGGPSAAVTLRVLKRLVEERYRDLFDRVDMFVGTSDGAFVSLYLAHALEIQKKTSLEAIRDCIAFQNEINGTFKVGPLNLARMASGLLSLYDGKAVRAVLERHFGQTRLADLKERKLAIVAFDASVWRTIAYRSFESGSSGITLVDAAMASSALLSLVPGFRAQRDVGVNKDHLMLDGVFGSNCTSMPALANALHYLGQEFFPSRSPYGIDECLSPIRLLSLGCLSYHDHALPARLINKLFSIPWPPLPGRSHAHTFEYGWLWYLIAGLQGLLALIQGSSLDGRFTTTQILGSERYHRFQPKIDAIDLVLKVMRDSSAADREASAMATTALAEDSTLVPWIDEHWYRAPRADGADGASQPLPPQERAVE